MSYPCPYCPTVPKTPHTLRKHLMGRVAYGGHELTASAAEQVISRVEGGTSAAGNLPAVPARPASRVVRRAGAVLREGHRRYLELLEDTAAIRDTLAKY